MGLTVQRCLDGMPLSMLWQYTAVAVPVIPDMYGSVLLVAAVCLQHWCIIVELHSAGQNLLLQSRDELCPVTFVDGLSSKDHASGLRSLVVSLLLYCG
jgi:hypothetical protein